MSIDCLPLRVPKALSDREEKAPGDDGITYEVIRFLHKIPGHPLRDPLV